MSMINVTLNDVYKLTNIGDKQNAIGTTFYAANHRRTPRPVPINTDDYGLVFFTRPQLNLSTDNLRAQRQLSLLLQKEPASIQRIIRSYLDPRLYRTDPSGNDCPFVDHHNAFMPLLTNHAVQVSGWPDPEIETYTSKPGAYKEVFGFSDGTAQILSAYDITASFRNMIGDPITALMLNWINYQELVHDGTLMPYPDYLVNKRVDYNTRIYRLILDRQRRFVQKIACTGAAWPVTTNLGAAFNYDVEKPLNQTVDTIDVRFRCIGAWYQDPMIIHAFNRSVAIMNVHMGSSRDTYGRHVPNTSVMIPVPPDQMAYFNDARTYPYIDPDSSELQWWTFRSEFAVVNTWRNQVLSALQMN